jgi:hypothetical protein
LLTFECYCADGNEEEKSLYLISDKLEKQQVVNSCVFNLKLALAIDD